MRKSSNGKKHLLSKTTLLTLTDGQIREVVGGKSKLGPKAEPRPRISPAN